ncbi:MAG: pilus assembly protein [Desulfobacterales bacterium]|nr:pilus assembly protein [Desulfobacterales bacterium]MDD4072498.1 pilus assembly protein [Desulfobacterales bacterium]MDD4391134.1 pilus assembly protein [Desulfobacterales bacterium]
MSTHLMRLKLLGCKKGVAAVEFALIVPVLLILIFGIIDFGRLIHARMVITNVSREGGNLASRFKNISSEGDTLLDLLQTSGAPLSLAGDGKIYITRIDAGTSSKIPPKKAAQVEKGSLSVNSSCENTHFGLSQELYDHLKFDETNQTADISEVIVTEVFYKYSAITPLPEFITNIFTDGTIILSSKSVF